MSRKPSKPAAVDDPRAEWVGMPECVNRDESPARSIIVHFRTDEDVRQFGELTGQSITEKAKSAWYPPMRRGRPSANPYVDES